MGGDAFDFGPRRYEVISVAALGAGSRRAADVEARVKALEADGAALRAALSRLAACAFGPPGELMAAADAARELLGE